jgi:hypothetical protein
MKLEPKNIDPTKALGALDNLANKIPEDIAKLLKKIAITLLGFFLIVAAYYGWTIGYSDTQQEGLKIAEDTKSIFMEDIEREYNRKRKNIHISDIEIDITKRIEEKMIQDEIHLQNRRDANRVIDPSEKSLNENLDLSSQRNLTGLPPALVPNSKSETEFIPGRDESNDLVPTLQPSKIDNSLERLEDRIQESETTTKRMEKTIERLENLEKRSLVKP